MDDKQCKELITIGAPVLHFYTMSNPGPTKKSQKQYLIKKNYEVF